MSEAAPGWYPDPNRPEAQMYWDGAAWRPDVALGTFPEQHQRYISFVPAIVVAFKRFADFAGRSSRSEYWWWRLFLGLVVGVPMEIGTKLDAANTQLCLDEGKSFIHCAVTGHASVIYVLALVLDLALVVPDFAITMRRLHDIGKPGSYAIVFVVVPLVFQFAPIRSGAATFVVVLTLAILVWEVIWFVRLGQESANQWGMVPQHPLR
jgi:uncharacterized membrane protein YhaH (DUF805 family)